MPLHFNPHHPKVIFYMGLEEGSKTLHALRELCSSRCELAELPVSRLHSPISVWLEEYFAATKHRIPKQDRVLPLHAAHRKLCRRFARSRQLNLLLFYNFEKTEIGAFLRDLRERGAAPILLKAALTDQNTEWTCLYLLQELILEHRFVSSFRQLHRAYSLCLRHYLSEDYPEPRFRKMAACLKKCKEALERTVNPNAAKIEADEAIALLQENLRDLHLACIELESLRINESIGDLSALFAGEERKEIRELAVFLKASFDTLQDAEFGIGDEEQLIRFCRILDRYRAQIKRVDTRLQPQFEEIVREAFETDRKQESDEAKERRHTLLRLFPELCSDLRLSTDADGRVYDPEAERAAAEAAESEKERGEKELSEDDLKKLLQDAGFSEDDFEEWPEDEDEDEDEDDPAEEVVDPGANFFSRSTEERRSDETAKNEEAEDEKESISEETAAPSFRDPLDNADEAYQGRNRPKRPC